MLFRVKDSLVWREEAFLSTRKVERDTVKMIIQFLPCRSRTCTMSIIMYLHIVHASARMCALGRSTWV